jgi:uncharacterized protein (TIGR02996 family)|nr:TIGR02996 domain-containing protein [Kofleriaceae bacterium]
MARRAAPKAAATAVLGRELLARCLESPDSRAPQLVYADWLEERDHSLAAVLRAPTDRAANGLAAPHAAAWFGPAATWIRDDDGLFERGMLRRIYGPTGKYVAAATQAQLLDVVATFGCRSTMLRGQSAKVGGCETLAWTTSLWWWDCQLDDARLAELARSPHLARLTSLTLEKVRCTNAGLRALAASPHLGRVRALGLPAPVHLGAYTADAVLAVVEALAIESLDVTGPTTMKLAALANAPAAARLRSLVTGGTARHDIRALVSGTRLTGLEHLTIDCYDRLDDADLAPVLANPALAKLTSLAVRCRDGVAPAMLARLKKRFGARLATR